MQTASTALRILSPRPRAVGDPNSGDAESIENVNTTELPNGALCFAVDVQVLYQLAKDSSGTILGAITPISGPGRWIPLAGFGQDLSGAGEAILSAGGTIDSGNAGTWSNLTSLGANWEGENAAIWTLNTTGGALTYSGADGRWFLITFDGTYDVAEAGTDRLEAVVDVNGALLPANSTPHASSATSINATARFMPFAGSFLAQLDSGDVLTPLVRNTDGTLDVGVVYFRVHAIPMF